MTEEELNARADEIIAQMTDEEKIAVCSGADFWHTKGFEQYGLPSIMMTDGPNGLRRQADEKDRGSDALEATCFPTAVTAAQTWNRHLLYEEGRAIGEEALEQKVAVVLGPGVNIKRSPLCGRNFEYYSEDPVVAGELGAAYVSGMQIETGVGTSLKHYACNSQEFCRMQSDSRIDERTLREIYLRAFEKVVKRAQPATVMCAYNKVNGTYCSDNAHLLTEILRDDWGFRGAVVTDWGALNNRTDAFLAGCDLAMPGGSAWGEKEVLKALDYEEIDLEAGEQGPLHRSVDASAKRVISLALRRNAALERSRDYSYDRTAHQETARRIAEEGAVLLKNENHLLPVPDAKDILLVGAMASNLRYQGSGSSHIHPTGIRQIRDCLPEAAYVPGCDEEGNVTEESLAEVTRAAARAKRVVVVTGLTDRYESEGYDRKNLSIPIGHDRMVRAALAGNWAVIVVVLGGSPMKLSWFEDVPAVLYAGLCGQEGGEALANLLTGRVNPSGKLTETWPMEEIDIPCYGFYGEADGSRESLRGAVALRGAANMSEAAPDSGSGAGGKTGGAAVRDRGSACRDAQYREGIYVGYRYYEKAGVRVRFPFGYGLSYTQFDYSDLRIDDRMVTVRVRNVGNMAGAEVVQLYVGNPQNGLFRPLKELRAFDKVFLRPGEEAVLAFQLASRDFSLYQDGWRIPTGTYCIMVGASSQDIRLVQEVEVTGEDLQADPDLMGSGSGPRTVQPQRTALPRLAIGVPPALSPDGQAAAEGSGREATREETGKDEPVPEGMPAAQESVMPDSQVGIPAAEGGRQQAAQGESAAESGAQEISREEAAAAESGKETGNDERLPDGVPAGQETAAAESGKETGKDERQPEGTQAAQESVMPDSQVGILAAEGSRQETAQGESAAEGGAQEIFREETAAEGGGQQLCQKGDRVSAGPGTGSWYVRPSGQPALGEWKRIMGGHLPENSGSDPQKPDWNSSVADLAPYSRICRHVLHRIEKECIRAAGGDAEDPVCRMSIATSAGAPLRSLRMFAPEIPLSALRLLLRLAGRRYRK